jgi:hypothetical protein
LQLWRRGEEVRGADFAHVAVPFGVRGYFLLGAVVVI